jgi:hypothetical protein
MFLYTVLKAWYCMLYVVANEIALCVVNAVPYRRECS